MSHTFIDRLFAGEMANVCYIDSDGGEEEFSRSVVFMNGLAVRNGANTSGFLLKHVYSNAQRIMMTLGTLFATKRTNCAWHLSRFEDRPTNRHSLELAQMLAQEQEDGVSQAEEMKLWLEGNVCDSLRGKVLARFRRTCVSPDPVFRYSGFDLQQWEVGNLCDGTETPQKAFELQTGIPLHSVPVGNPVRHFMDWMQEAVGNEELIRQPW